MSYPCYLFDFFRHCFLRGCFAAAVEFIKYANTDYSKYIRHTFEIGQIKGKYEM